MDEGRSITGPPSPTIKTLAAHTGYPRKLPDVLSVEEAARLLEALGKRNIRIEFASRWMQLSTSHDDRQPRVLDHRSGDAAENPLAQSGMAVGPHDHELDASVDGVLAQNIGDRVI